jgi:AraC-like DNA-binding protein
MGEVLLSHKMSTSQFKFFSLKLNQLGFEILDNQHQRQIERIKALLIAQIQTGSLEAHFSISEYLKKNLLKDYSSLSRLFSQVEGKTIEQFFIAQKIEKIKEWLMYDELSLSEMSYRLGYSSIAHLSAQFKKITGLTPTQFKKIGGNRKPIDLV